MRKMYKSFRMNPQIRATIMNSLRMPPMYPRRPVEQNIQAQEPSCGYLLSGIVFRLIMNGLLFRYCVFCMFSKLVPFWAACIAGFWLSPYIIVVALVCWALRLAGVQVPFVH